MEKTDLNSKTQVETESTSIEYPRQDKPEKSLKNTTIFNKIIKGCIYVLVFLLPLWFLPFTGNVLDLNKQVLMVFVLTIALIAWLGKLLTQEKIEWYGGIIVVIFLAFVIVCGLSTIFSLRSYDSLMGPDTHLSRALINIIYFFVLFLLLVNYREEGEKRNAGIFKFITVFLASSAIVGIIGLLQILGRFIFPWDFAKANSFNTIGTTNSLGIFLAALLPLVLSLLFKTKGEKDKKDKMVVGFKIFLSILFVLGVIITLLLNFRILWIVSAVGMVMIIGFWLARRYNLSIQNLGWIAIPVVILALCLIFLIFRPGSLFNLNLPLEVGLSPKGGWNIVKEVIQHKPVLGSGPETFIYNYSLYKPISINQTVFWNLRFTNAPSEILSLISEIGILGAIVFVLLILTFLTKTIKGLIGNKEGIGQMSELKIGLFSSWLVLAVSWFLYPQNLILMFVFWFFLTLLIVVNKEEKDIKILNLESSDKTALIAGFGFIILIIIVVGLLYLEGSKFMAEAQYKKGLDLIREEKLDAGINTVIQATITNPYEDKFYRNLAQLFLVQINQSLNNLGLEPEERTRQIQAGISNAINSATRATTLNSRDVANWIVRGSIYRNLVALVNGAGAWAVKSYEKASELEPTNPFVYTEMARTYISGVDLLRAQAQDEEIRGQIINYLNRAVESYNKAIELKPNYAPAHFELALIYDQQGKINEAIVNMENSLRIAPRDTGVAFQLGVLYYKSSQFDKAKLAFIRAVGLDPNFSNARYFLGLLYDREGNKEDAIDQFERIAELNPDNDSVKQILANLRAGQPALGSPELGPPEQPEEIPLEEGQPEELKP